MYNNKTINIMKTRKLFPWLLGLMLTAITSPTFTACSSDDDDNNNSGGNGTEQTDSLTAMYDDLAIFQKSMCTIDSAGTLVRYEVGVAIQESDPQHRYIGVDNIEEAAKIFATWIAPDVNLAPITPTVTDLTAELTDTLGRAQGTIYFRAGSGTTVAEVTASAGTNLKYVNRITFLLNSAWPYNSETLVWHKGDIRKFFITGKARKQLTDKDKELAFVLVREGKNGQTPMWVAVTNDKYGWPNIFKKDSFDDIQHSDYCPGMSKAKTISQIMSAEWAFFKSRFAEAQSMGGGELRDGGSYWIDNSFIKWLTDYKSVIMLSNSWDHGVRGDEDPEQFLMKIDWLNDGDIPLRATAGTDIADGSFADVSGSCSNLFDGNSSTMWETNHLWWANINVALFYVEFESSELVKPTGYTLVTGNKDQWPTDNCNPGNWKLYGKKRLRNEWTLIDQRYNQSLPFESYREVSYSISNPDEYQYFRLEIVDNQAWLKLADFKFKY